MPIVGQLNPWPGARAPGKPTCIVVEPLPPTEPTTLITSISATDAPLPTATPPPRDTVTILSVDEDKGQGITRFIITATSSVKTDPQPILICTGTGVNPLGQSVMTSLGNGNFILDVAVKHGLDTVTVTSSYGGQMTLTLV